MGSIRLQNVCKQFGPRLVLQDVTIDLHTNQTAALVGPNGAGKTTLFRLITGEIAPDSGSVTRSRGLEVGYLPQEHTLNASASLRDAVAEAFADLLALERRLEQLSESIAADHDAPHAAEHLKQYDRHRARFEAAGGYTFEQRLNEILGGLGFRPEDYGLPVAALSGGQRCRAALAKLLLRASMGSSDGPPFLLLDEPTNHLDLDAVRWLELFLAAHRGGAVIVSHDRYLLDRVAERVIEVVPATPARGGNVASYIGNYSAYVEQRELRRLTQVRAYEKDQAFLAKERDFIARFGAGQRAKEARGRKTRLQRRIDAGEFTLEQPGSRSVARLEFGATGGGGASAAARGKELIRLEGLRKQYDAKVLFSGLDLEIYAGQCVGVTGPNGTGKSTLLKILLGQVRPDEGKVRVSSTARIGYFAQDASELDPTHTVIDEILAVRGDLLERDARHVAARFLFVDEQPFQRLGDLSGGEQSRVRFMKLILSSPDLLILDEPTNHLDIASREVLEASLQEFDGTVLAVSHDRYFLDQISERLLVMRPESVKLYHGNYTDYIERIERERGEKEAAREAARADARSAARADARQAARSPARGQQKRDGEREGRKPGRSSRSASPFAKLSVEELEELITRRQQELAHLQERFGSPDLYRDVAALAELQQQFAAVQAELTAAEEAWLEKAE